jgi:universal stress protein E
MSVAAECYCPLHEGIINKVREIRPDLVMKAPSGIHPLRRFSFGPSDWHLMRECPVTLMLVRQHLWKSPPQFAALVDVSEDVTRRLAETIVHTSEHFALGCRGELDVVYSETTGDEAEGNRRAAALQRLTHEYRIPPARVHVLSGDPDLTLPEFAARHSYDALVLGGLTHRKGIAPLVGTLTSRLVEALGSDFILVKREPAHLAAAQPSGQQPAADIGVAWNAVFGD